MTRAFVILALYSIVCVITVDAQEPEVPPWTGAAASTAITAEEILRRWADAVGGDKLRAIRNVYTRGDYDGTYGHGVDEEWNTRLGQRRQLNVVGSGHGALRIPFEEEDGHIFLQVRINNSGPLWFGLDTAATRSIIDKHWAASLGLQSEGSQQVEGAGGYEEGSIIKNISIELLGVELKHQTVWALPLDGLAPANGREIAGIIAYELFSHFVVDIDFITRQINLYEPKTYEYRGAGQSIPLMVQQDGAIYVQAKVAAPNHDPIDGQFVIDTGGNNTLMLARTFVEQHRLLESVGQTLPARGGGVVGEVQLGIGRVKSLQLGNFVIQNPITGFVKVGEIADRGKDGNIGGKFLRRFRVTFDYSRRRMILEPNSFFWNLKNRT